MEGSSQANYAQLAKRRRDILNAILNRDINALRHASTGQRSRDKRKLNCNEYVLPSSLSLEQKVAGIVHGLLKENEKCRTNVVKLRKKNEELLVMSRTSEEKCIRLENRVAALEKKNAKLKYFYEEKIGLGGAETQIVLMKQKSEKLQGIIDSERTINRGLLSGMMEEKSKRSCLEAELKKVNEKKLQQEKQHAIDIEIMKKTHLTIQKSIENKVLQAHQSHKIKDAKLHEIEDLHSTVTKLMQDNQILKQRNDALMKHVANLKVALKDVQQHEDLKTSIKVEKISGILHTIFLEHARINANQQNLNHEALPPEELQNLSKKCVSPIELIKKKVRGQYYRNMNGPVLNGASRIEESEFSPTDPTVTLPNVYLK